MSSTKRNLKTPRKGPTIGTYMENIKNIRRKAVASRKDYRKHHHNTKELQFTT
jgi:hypothetical protein